MLIVNTLLLGGLLLAPLAIFGQRSQNSRKDPHPDVKEQELKVKKSDDQWKQELSDEQYHILREKGTERPYTGKFNKHKEEGVYTCAACHAELFRSDSKFDSGCGWPSFYQSIDNKKIVTRTDNSHGMTRTEIMCANCGGHLGHLFDDGPAPTGLRYCVNSVSLDFKKVNVAPAPNQK